MSDQKNQLSVSDKIVLWFIEKGIQRIFIYPGGTIAPLIESCIKHGVILEVFKNEQGAAYAAMAFARITNSTQVVFVSSGPGVTNVLTPLADAFYDSTPLFLITGQVATKDLYSKRNVRQRGFQETPTLAIVNQISKASDSPLSAEEALPKVAKLFSLSNSGRSGPTVLDLPIDIQRSEYIRSNNPKEINAAHDLSVSINICDDIAFSLATSKRPIILLGQGALKTQAFNIYKELVTKSSAFVVNSLLGLGSYSTQSEKYLGYIGHTGHLAANTAVHQSDFLLALGTRLDLRQTGTETNSFVPNGVVAWVNNDPSEINHPRINAKWAIVGDAGVYAENILNSLKNISEKDWSWMEQIKKIKTQDIEDNQVEQDSISPKHVLLCLKKIISGSKGVVVTGVGSHQQWAARHLTFGPESWKFLTSGGHGAMGYDLPSAIGAAIAISPEPVLCVVGDGSLLMNIQELASLAERSLKVKILVLNNSRLGIVSQFQKNTWGTDPTTGDFKAPNFESIARAFQIPAATLRLKEEIESKLMDFWHSSGPVLLNVIINKNADVVPMLLAGKEMDDMWMGRNEQT